MTIYVLMARRGDQWTLVKKDGPPPGGGTPLAYDNRQDAVMDASDMVKEEEGRLIVHVLHLTDTVSIKNGSVVVQDGEEEPPRSEEKSS